MLFKDFWVEIEVFIIDEVDAGIFFFPLSFSCSFLPFLFFMVW